MRKVKLTLGSILLSSIIAILILSMLGFINFTRESFLITISIAFFYALTFSIVNILFFRWLSTIFPWEHYLKARLFIGGLGFLILNVLTFASCRFVTQVYFLKLVSVHAFFQNITYQSYGIPIVVALLLVLGYHAFYFYQTIQQQQLKQQKLIAAHAKAQYDALKQQIDPHFLFNNLNVLTALIEENPEKAQNYTSTLANIYRYLIEHRHKKIIHITDEIAFAQKYMTLVRMRYENHISFEVAPPLFQSKANIIPLSLQLLLENAIKHNKISAQHPLTIRLEQEDNYLSVENTFNPKPQLQKGLRMGLQNIKSRYGLLTSREVQIIEHNGLFIVKIPILENDSNLSL